jgi:hypothetical protein
MPRCNAQQSERWALRLSATLFPISEGVDADTHGLGKLSLSEPDEPSQCGNVVARFNVPEHQALSDTCGNGSSELGFGQFWNVSHRNCSM